MINLKQQIKSIEIYHDFFNEWEISTMALESYIDELGYETLSYAIMLSSCLHQDSEGAYHFFRGYCEGRINSL